jgi:colanic acid/amylovoran biosynthesis glycosyltransferase
MGCDSDKISVHRTGINLKRFKYREETNRNSKNIKLLSIGRLIEKKGFFFSIRAISIIIKKYPDLIYNIVGDGELKNYLKELILNLGLDDKVNILGYKTSENIIELINYSNILLAPSIKAKNGDQEGIPNSIKEAMAIGVPVISTKHSGIPELVKDNITGCLVPEGSINKLADKIIFLIENKKISELIKLKSRKSIELYYDIEKLNMELLEIYKRLINNN